MTTNGPKYNCDPGHPLAILAEECAELIQAIMKLQRFGPGGAPGFIGVNPQREIVREMGDVFWAIRYAVSKGMLTQAELLVALADKERRVKELFGDRL